MDFSRTLVASAIVFLLVFHLVTLVHAVEPKAMVSGSASYITPEYMSPLIDCGGACEARCFLSSRPRLCKRACVTCCYRCNCVPPGTSGNLDACPCYATMTTRDNQRKCP